MKKTPSFRYLLKRVRDEFGAVKAREVTTARVQQFVDRLKDDSGLSASSVNPLFRAQTVDLIAQVLVGSR